MKNWSTIAKTVQCLRDRHKAVKIEWVQAFDVVEADTYAKNVLPQPFSGRWRNIEGIEASASNSCQATFFFKRPVCNPSWCLSLQHVSNGQRAIYVDLFCLAT